MWNEHWIFYPHGHILRKLFKMFSMQFPKWETWVDVPTSAVPPPSRWWLQQAEGLRWRNMSHTSLTMGGMYNLALISGPVLHSCTALKDNLEACPHQEHPEHLSQFLSPFIFPLPFFCACPPHLPEDYLQSGYKVGKPSFLQIKRPRWPDVFLLVSKFMELCKCVSFSLTR